MGSTCMCCCARTLMVLLLYCICTRLLTGEASPQSIAVCCCCTAFAACRSPVWQPKRRQHLHVLLPQLFVLKFHHCSGCRQAQSLLKHQGVGAVPGAKSGRVVAAEAPETGGKNKQANKQVSNSINRHTHIQMCALPAALPVFVKAHLTGRVPARSHGSVCIQYDTAHLLDIQRIAHSCNTNLHQWLMPFGSSPFLVLIADGLYNLRR